MYLVQLNISIQSTAVNQFITIATTSVLGILLSLLSLCSGWQSSSPSGCGSGGPPCRTGAGGAIVVMLVLDSGRGNQHVVVAVDVWPWSWSQCNSGLLSSLMFGVWW